jgi:hypothetical protein
VSGETCVLAVASGAAEVCADVVFEAVDLLPLFAPTWLPPPSFGTTSAPVASTPAGTLQGGWLQSVTVRGAQAGEPTIEPVKTLFTQFLSEKT